MLILSLNYQNFKQLRIDHQSLYLKYYGTKLML